MRLLEILGFGSRHGGDVKCEVQEHLHAEREIANHRRSAPVLGQRPGRLLPQIDEPASQPCPDLAVPRSQPAKVTGHRLGVEPFTGNLLTLGQTVPVHRARRDLDDEHAGSHRVASRDILAGRDNQGAGGFVGRRDPSGRSRPRPA